VGLNSDAVIGNLNLLEPQELVPICVEIAFNTELHSSSAGEMGENMVQITGSLLCRTVAYPGIFFGGGGGSTNSVEDRGQRGRGSGGGSPLVRGSGGSCNLVQEISFHIVKFS